MPLHTINHGDRSQTQAHGPDESDTCDSVSTHFLLHNHREFAFHLLEKIETLTWNQERARHMDQHV